MSEKKMVRRSVAIALGIICIILIAGMVEIWLYYLVQDIEKDETITSLNNQIFQLNSQIEDQNNSISSLNFTVTNLQNRIASDNSTIRSLASNVTILQEALNDLLNETAWVGLDELQAELQASNLNYINRTVAVEGNLSGPFLYFPENMPQWSYEWVNPDGTLNNDFGVGWSGDDSFASTNVIVIGVVREGNRVFDGALLPSYFIEAKSFILLK